MSFRSLLGLQQAFSDAIFCNGDNRILSCFKGSSDAAKGKRLDIYRNNVFHSLTIALADLYPVVKRLVGDQFFNATAAEYIRRCPPRSAAMVRFAADFPEFLKCFEHTGAMPYLADVAEVEVARHQAYHAEDAPVLSVADFSAVPAKQLSRTRLLLHPSVTLLRSRYPILQIWQANQGDSQNDNLIDLDSGGTTLAVYRPHLDVHVGEVGLATHTLLARLQQKETLENAILRATESDSTASITESIAFCIREGLFTRIIGS